MDTPTSARLEPPPAGIEDAIDALRQSTSRLELGAELAGLAIWSIELPSGRATHDALLQRMLGVTEAERDLPVAELWRSRVPPEELPPVQAAMAAAIAARTGPLSRYRLEHRVVRPDGTTRWLAVIGQVECDRDSGEPVRIVGVARDVTDERRRDAESRFLVDASARLSTTLDPQATIRELVRLAVPALADLAAYNVRDGDAPVLRTVAVHHLDPAKEVLAAELSGRYPLRADAAAGSARVLRTGEPELVPNVPTAMFEAVAHDAEHLALLRGIGFRSLMNVPLVARGRTLGVLGFAVSESGRRYGPADLAFAQELARRAALAIDNAGLYQAERRARAVAERLQAVTAALSEALTAEQVMDVVLHQGLAALGAGSGTVSLLADGGAELEIARIAGYAAEMVAPFHRIPVAAPLPVADAVRSGEPVWLASPDEADARYPSLDMPRRDPGARAWAAVPLVVDGRATGVLALGFPEPHHFPADERAFITTLARQGAQALERARLFEAERGARAEAERANRAKAEFLATMSHELRTPINAALGYGELMAMGIHGPVTDTQRDVLERIRRSQHRLLTLVNDVLSFARLDAGQARLALADVPVEQAMADAESLVAPQLNARGLAFDVRCEAPGALVRADHDRLGQILLNLLSNAIKFTGPGGRVALTCHAENGVVRLRVADTGRGIPADKLESIFEPFVQVETGLTRTHEGTGLGLAISRQLARGMGGELTVESTVGAGATFTLTLPRAG